MKLDLYEQGYLMFLPESEQLPFDIVIMKDGVFKTVQIKTRSMNSKGSVQVRFRYKMSSKKPGYKVVNKEAVDLYAVYCPETDCCYYFDPAKVKGISIDIKVDGKNLRSNCHDGDDMREV